MEASEKIMVAFLTGLVAIIIAAAVIICRKKEKTEGEGCLSLVALTILWAAFCAVVEIILEIINN